MLEKILAGLLRSYLPNPALHVSTLEEIWMQQKPRGKPQNLPWLDGWKVKIEDVTWKEPR